VSADILAQFEQFSILSLCAVPGQEFDQSTTKMFGTKTKIGGRVDSKRFKNI